MIKKSLEYSSSSLIFVLILSLTSCSYNSEEDLYPVVELTEPLSYSSDILPILETNCYSCHQDASICGDVNLEGYNNLVIRVENGSLLGAIMHEEGWMPMPQGADKLSDSQIEKISTWVDEDYPNN